MRVKNVLFAFLICLLFPYITYASSYDDAVDVASDYITTGSYKDSYRSFINTNVDYGLISSSGGSVSGESGGLLTIDEFNRTYKTSALDSYLYNGSNFWFNNKKSTSGNDDNGVRVVEYVNSNVAVKGSGSYSNPWYFIKSYNVHLKVKTEDGYISLGKSSSSSKVKELNASYSVNKVHVYLFDSESYISNDCGLDFDQDSGSLIIENITSDKNCNVYFGVSNTIKYNCNGGNETNSDTIYFCGNTSSLISGTCTRSGYDFKGWCKENTSSCTAYPSGTKISDIYSSCGDYTMYAKWEHSSCDVKFKNESSIHKIVTQTYGSNYVLPDTNPTKEGYNFAGWYTKLNGGEQITTSITNVCSYDTLYAHYEESPKEQPKVLILNEKNSKYSLYFIYDTKTYNKNDSFKGKKIYNVLSINDFLNVSYSIKDLVTTIDFDSSFYNYYPTSTKQWFSNYYYVEKVSNLQYLNTLNVTDMSLMFYNCGAGKNSSDKMSSFNISGMDKWNTSNVTDMSYMFNYAGEIASSWSIGNLSKWDVSNVVNMEKIFCSSGKNASSWSVGNLSNWDTKNVINMTGMFANSGLYSSSWTVGDLSKWNVSKVTSMSNMFSYTGYNSSSWSVGDLSTKQVTSNGNSYKAWDVSNVTNMFYMFAGSGSNAKTWSVGDISNWNTSNVTDMSWMFRSSGEFSNSWNAGNLSKWDVSNVTNMQYMFAETGLRASKWYIGNISNWNTSNVSDMSRMFYKAGYNASSWSIGDLSTKQVKLNGKTYNAWDVSNVTDMYAMFCNAGLYSKTWNIGNLSKWDVSSVTDMGGMFNTSGLYSNTWYIGDISNWDVSGVTDMSRMFQLAGGKLSEWNIGNLDNWDTSNVTNMYAMFSDAGNYAKKWNVGDLSTKLVTINGTKYIAWDVSSVTNMSFMFSSIGHDASSLNIGNIGNWNTSNVTNMYCMFLSAGYNAKEFIFDLSTKNVTINGVKYKAWDVSKVTTMHGMFGGTGHESKTWSVGDISNWDTSNVTDMCSMFGDAGYKSKSWSVGDISKWNTSMVTDMTQMFRDAGHNANYYLDLSKWKVNLVVNHDGFNSGATGKVKAPKWKV